MCYAKPEEILKFVHNRNFNRCDPSHEKGRVGCHIVKFTFSAFYIENFMTNQEILTCWWVLDHFGSQNVQRRWIPP